MSRLNGLLRFTVKTTLSSSSWTVYTGFMKQNVSNQIKNTYIHAMLNQQIAIVMFRCKLILMSALPASTLKIVCIQNPSQMKLFVCDLFVKG